MMTRVSAYRQLDEAGPRAPWLTLVHGATQNHNVFSGQLSVFKDRYRLLLIDLPGHGESADVPGPFGQLEYAEAVLGAMNAAGVETTHFWGTHTGAAVALLLAVKNPQRFASLILEGVVIPGRVIPSVTEYYGRARATLRAHGLELAIKEWFEESPWFDVMRRDPVRCRADQHYTMLKTFSGAPWRDERAAQAVSLTSSALATLTMPVLLINGEHDVADFFPAAEELEATLPQAQRVTIKGGGGFPLWEFPEQVNVAVMRFLDGAA